MTAIASSVVPPIRETYRDITLYAPDRGACRVDLSDNTNRHGMPPAAALALRDLDADTITRYPSLYAAELKQAIAAYTGVSADCIVTGCGSDDVLDSAIRAFGETGDAIAFHTPTFPMIPIFAKMNGLRAMAVPFSDDFAVDANALLATGARLVYVCSPNNPTGTLASQAALEALMAESPGVVIIDEAYGEYAGVTSVSEAIAAGRVLVTRTLSKAFGLAGLRVGYGIGAPGLVAEVEKSRGPYKVSALAQRAAIAALGDGLVWARSNVVEDIAARDRLLGELLAMGLNPVPSRANFVLVPVANSARLAAVMRARGVAVRPFTDLPDIGDAIRISIGPWAMLAECLRVLTESLEVLA